MLSHSRSGGTVKLVTFTSTLLFTVPLFGQVALTTAQIVKRVSPSVVVIQGRTSSGDVLGSGFIVSKDGKIVTNLHVIRDMKTASVQLSSGEIFDSLSVLGTDERRDLAVVRIAGFNLPTLELGNSDALTVGEPLVIVGSPRGLEGTVTAGILSSIRDSGEGYKVLQTDAAVNPGNSGGPLLNNKGQAVGVISFKLRSSEGLNFAIPINYVRGLLDNLHQPRTLEQMQENQTTGLTLTETLGWLKQNIPLGKIDYTYDYQENGYHVVNTIHKQAKAWSFESCTVTFGEDEAVDSHTPTWISRYTLSLGSLSVVSVEHVSTATKPEVTIIDGAESEYRVTLSTNSKDIHTLYSAATPPKLLADYLQSSLSMHFDDEEVARRVVVAFRHAAELCKGH